MSDANASGEAIVWASPKRDRAPRSSGGGLYFEFAEALRANPGEWAVFKEDASAVTVTAIHKGTYMDFRPAGAFQATSEISKTNRTRGRIYVRFVGKADA